MTDTTAASLPELAAKLEAHVDELRRHVSLIAAANAAADETIVRQIAGPHVPGGGAGDLDHVCAQIAVRGFTDGAVRIEQLRTAGKVFAR